MLWSVHHQSIMSGDPEPRTTARCHGVPELAPRRSAPQASTGPPGTPLASRPDVSRVALAPYSCMRYARCPQGPKRSAPAPNGPLSCVHHPSRHSDQVETRLARLISSSDGPAPAELRLMLRAPPCVGRLGAYLAEPRVMGPRHHLPLSRAPSNAWQALTAMLRSRAQNCEERRRRRPRSRVAAALSK